MPHLPRPATPALALGLLLAAVAPRAQATWSIAAFNPRTGTYAVAAASCSGGVYGIQAVLPGRGAIIVQAASNGDARQAALAMLREGAPADAILARIADPASGFAPERQQYAVLVAGDPRARTHTGSAVSGAKGSVVGAYTSVQVNLMLSDAVLARTAAALGRADWRDDLAMGRRLLAALEAGAAAGGDRRCGRMASNTAFLGLYRRDDPQDRPWVELSVQGIAAGTDSGTARLRTLWRRWLRDGTRAASTRVFVVPAPVAAARSP